MSWNIAGESLKNRLFIGTAQYPSPDIMVKAIKASEAEVMTVSLRRQSPNTQGGEIFWSLIKDLGCRLLPNTAHCRTAKEAITTAQLARELFNTIWIKLEVIGDDYTLQPDPFESLLAAKELISQGFEVFPYCTDDLVTCTHLLEAGCRILMPWAAPIGTAQGILNPFALRTLRHRFPEIPLLIDAGLGTPSHAAQAMEMGYDGILLNSAIALSDDPIKMAEAFNLAVRAGRFAYEAGVVLPRDIAVPSTPIIGRPFWHE